jgi:hypothetical protein
MTIAAHLQGQRKSWLVSMQTPPKAEKTGEHTSNTAGRMVEQVVGSGELDAPSASPV